MMLGELIEELKKHDPQKRVKNGFSNPHSWRGDYSGLAFEPAESVRVEEMLSSAVHALGSIFEGYKGGSYEMTEYSDVYLAKWGETGETLGPMLLGYMLKDEVLERSGLPIQSLAQYAIATAQSLGEACTEFDVKAVEIAEQYLTPEEVKRIRRGKVQE